MLLACCTGRLCLANLECLGCDASAHVHHRSSAAAALQFGAFAQWRLRGWRHARRAVRLCAGFEPHAQQHQPLAVLAIGMRQAKVARAPKPLGQDALEHQPQKVRSFEGRFRGQSANSPSLRPALRVLRFAAQRNCDLTPKTIRPRRHPFPFPNLTHSLNPLWMRRGAQGKAVQGLRLSEPGEFERDPAFSEHRRLPVAKRRDAGTRVAFLLLTFLWRSKEK